MQAHMRMHMLMHVRTHARLAILLKSLLMMSMTYWDDEIGDNDDGQDDNDET